MTRIKDRRSWDNLKDGCVHIFIYHTGGAIIDNGAKENFCVKDTMGHLTIKVHRSTKNKNFGRNRAK